MPEEKIPTSETPEALDDAAKQPDGFVWTRRKIMACTVGSLAVFSSPFAVIELDEAYPDDAPNYSAALTPGDRSLPTKEEEQCPEIPESFIGKAENMLLAPESPSVTKAVEEALLSSVTGNYLINPFSPHDIQRKIANRTNMWERPNVRLPVAQKSAQRLGLTLFDNSEHIKRAGNGEGVDTTLSRRQVLAETRGFLNNYGITVNLATKKEFPVTEPIGSQTISDSIHTPQALYDIIRITAAYPKEYLALSGIKHIVLANELKSGKENEVFNTSAAVTDGETIWFDVEHLNAQVFAHELGHGVMQAMCGGHEATQHDQQLSKDMKGDHTYDTEYTGTSYIDYAADLAEIEKRMLQGQPYQNQLQGLQADAVDIATVTDYAHKDPPEDGAETLSVLTTDTFYRMRHAMAMPVLRNKLSVVLGRLLYYRPHLAEFFMETSLKNEKSSSPIDVIMPGQPSNKR